MLRTHTHTHIYIYTKRNCYLTSPCQLHYSKFNYYKYYCQTKYFFLLTIVFFSIHEILNYEVDLR